MKLSRVLAGGILLAALLVPMGNPPADACGVGCLEALRPGGAWGGAPLPSHSRPLPDAAPPPVRYGAFSLARPPSFRFGVAVGHRDPRAAREAAEAGCRSVPRGCTQIVEFTEACVAVAEGVRRVALIMTSDPRTYEVRAIEIGTASNPADAQRAALRECASLERGALHCRLLQVSCGPR
nr:DUF4189 domain-containing protein [uncultured Roseococcus sp.]